MAEPSVILLSGGLDSAANLAFCALRDRPVLAVTCRYGQRAADAEVRAARALAAHYAVPHETIDITWLGKLGGSSLTDDTRAVPTLATNQLDEMSVIRQTAESVWVPNRNGVFINLAAALAERRGASRVVVGFNREEAATFPDNSAEYLARASHALALSTATGVRVFSYTTELDKSEIVAQLRAADPKFPWPLLWSCYLRGAEPCGTCESCRRSARARAQGSEEHR